LRGVARIGAAGRCRCRAARRRRELGGALSSGAGRPADVRGEFNSVGGGSSSRSRRLLLPPPCRLAAQAALLWTGRQPRAGRGREWELPAAPPGLTPGPLETSVAPRCCVGQPGPTRGPSGDAVGRLGLGGAPRLGPRGTESRAHARGLKPSAPVTLGRAESNNPHAEFPFASAHARVETECPKPLSAA
jgi:hypothetical protein